MYFAKNVAYFPFNSWLSFQRPCRLLWGSTLMSCYKTQLVQLAMRKTLTSTEPRSSSAVFPGSRQPVARRRGICSTADRTAADEYQQYSQNSINQSVFVYYGMTKYRPTTRSKKAIHTHPFNGPFSRTNQVSRYQKGKTNMDFTEARDSQWQ